MTVTKGSVMVIGGGIAGVQAALDLAESGFYVHLVEQSAAIGGRMAQLDKTFPTNDCSACILSPKLVECGRHLNINLITLSEVVDITGEPGNFTVKLIQQPRYIDMTKCLACGDCARKCPKSVSDDFNLGLNKRKAIYLQYPQAVPLKYAIDPKHCIRIQKPGRCGFCLEECKAGAINFDDVPRELDLNVGAVILALGFCPFDPSKLDYTGYRLYPNVVTALDFERILSPSGPTKGHLLRPSDSKQPKKIAWLQCVGSRDINRGGHLYCSNVCCMYALKQAVIAKEHAGKDLDTSIFFMDMRTHGKGFEQYYNRARTKGVRFNRVRVHSVLPTGENDTLLLNYVDEHGEIKREEFDMVVLSTGLEMDKGSAALATRLGVKLDGDNFVNTPVFRPIATSRPGIFVCGAASEPKDIPASVVDASAAALEAQRLLSSARWTETKKKVFPEERDVYPEPPRIGVFVCRCGINIASVIDVEAVKDYASGLPDVVLAQVNTFTCSQDTIDQIARTIKEYNLNRVVVASCSPRTHEHLFQETLRGAGLNMFLFELANIRDQDSWVHQNEPELATEKAKDLVRMAVAKVRNKMPLPYHKVEVHHKALVVGGGVAGMTAALSLADQGFPVYLVEQSNVLGGHARLLNRSWQGQEIDLVLENLINRVRIHPNITVFLSTKVDKVQGSVGQFITSLSNGKSVEHGAAIISVGAKAYRPQGQWNYLYGEDDRVKLLLDVDGAIKEDADQFKDVNSAVFIHCVGSRVPDRPYCSRFCCTHAINQALRLKEINPDMDVFMIYRDIRTYGQRERLYQKAREKGVVFIRYDLDHLPEVSKQGDKIILTAFDPLLNTQVMLSPDLLVLATGVVPSDASREIAGLFKCSLDADGFLLEAHMKLRPVDFATDGVFLAGLCHYPKPMDESIAQAQAAAARAATILSKDAVEVESIVAHVDPEKCTGCGLCNQVCAYQAVKVNSSSGRAEVDVGLCKGCGACVAGCRSDAITLLNMENRHVMAEVETCMWA